MSRFDFTSTPIAGVMVVQRKPIGDARGHLTRFYCSDEFAAAGVTKPLAQINVTMTQRRGTVRGMHYQRPPHAEIKLVSCLRGEVFDVAVDVRRSSPTFLRWHAEVLSPGNNRSLLIPEGVAHGFQTLTEDCELLYLHTASFAAAAEEGLDAVDPRLAIQWPLEIAERSARDGSHPRLSDSFLGVQV